MHADLLSRKAPHSQVQPGGLADDADGFQLAIVLQACDHIGYQVLLRNLGQPAEFQSRRVDEHLINDRGQLFLSVRLGGFHQVCEPQVGHCISDLS